MVEAIDIICKILGVLIIIVGIFEFVGLFQKGPVDPKKFLSMSADYHVTKGALLKRLRNLL